MVRTQRNQLKTLFVTIGLLGSIIIIGLVIAAVARNKQKEFIQRRKDEQKTEAAEKAKQILFGIQGYAAIDKKLPPPVYFDQTGKVRHSWRTLILPFISKDDLYKQIDLKRSWDSTEQVELITETEVSVYKSSRCQSEHTAGTSFVMVSGRGTVFDMRGNERPATGVLHWFDFPEKKTALIIELPESDIYWGEPTDVSLDDAVKIIQNAQFDVVVGFSDGSVEHISPSTPETEIRALFKKD